jgi:arginine N-succinyltransferase
MSLWQFRAARAEDLPNLGSLLPSWELEAATFVDDSDDDQLLLAIPFDRHQGAAAPAGCIRLRRHIGLAHPRYWYHLGEVVHAAADLGMFRRERTLLLGNDLTGSAELAEFAIDRRVDPASAVTLAQTLVRAALLLLYRDTPANLRASSRVIAPMPGLRDRDGSSPFWRGLGRHFYAGDVDRAMARFGGLWLTHVAALLPRHPLVVSMLDGAAQAAIGSVDAASHLWRDACVGSGLRPGQHVHVHDAGPVFEASLELLNCAQPMHICGLHVRDDIENPQWRLLTSESGAELWQLPTSAIENGAVGLPTALASDLGFASGQLVWVA